MSGLKLQILSNPSSTPSFVIGNPQRVKKPKKKRIAKKSRKRENTLMSKRRRRHATSKKKRPHRRHRRKNPFEQVLTSGKKTVTVGPFLTRKEQAKATRTVKHKISQLRALRKKDSKIAPALRERMLKKFEGELRNMRKHRAAGRAHGRRAISEIRALKAKGFRTHKARRVSMKTAIERESSKSKKRSYGIIGREGNVLIIRKKDGTIKRVIIKKRSKKKAAAPKKRRHKKRKHAKKHAKRRARPRKKKGKKMARRRKHRAKRKNPHRRHRKNPRRRRGHKGKHHHKRAKHKRRHRRNPLGGTMGKALDWITGGNPREAAFILGAAAVSEPLASAALNIPGLGSVLMAVNSALATVSPNVGAAIVPILPGLLVALAAEAAGQKLGPKGKVLQEFGRGLMITNIVDLGEALGDAVSTMMGLSGVSFTPTMGRHRGMRGVSFTKNHMGAVPRGLSAVPRGMGSYLPSPGGTLSTDADFGGIPHGMGGLTYRDKADFGDSRQMADFGGVDFTMGAYPSMRGGGSHTGDVMFADPTLDANGEEDDTSESNDHTV